MPREVFRSLTAQEQKFIFHFLREGGVEENIWIVEKKARLPKGTGQQLYKRKHVQAEIERRKAQVELEQAKLIARDQNRAADEREKRQAITLDKIERKLDEFFSLNIKEHGALVHSVLQTALVYSGVIKSGRMERTAPVDAGNKEKEATAGGGYYDSVFDALRAAQEKVEPAPLQPDTPGAHTAPQPPPVVTSPSRAASSAAAVEKPSKYAVTIT